MSDNLRFKTHVQLKNIIGKDLINDDNIAILELVKNSFDANAKRVSIIFKNIKDNNDHLVETIDDINESTSRIIISDNGVGMSFADIRDKWLNIAYSEKKSSPIRHKRMMAGAKGIGRFSCDRLGEFLNLYTKQKNEDNYIQLRIDWKEFENEEDKNKEIQTINLDYSILSKSELLKLGIPSFKQGVVLEMVKLRKRWSETSINKKTKAPIWETRRFVELKQYLEKLINPNQAFEKDDFGIYIEALEFKNENANKSDHEKFIGKVENRIFEKLEFKTTLIESEIINDGKEIVTELKDKGETVFKIIENNSFYPNLKSIKLSINYLNPYAKSFFTRQTGIKSVNYGSIFLFINGFRIPPYGDSGDDWLGLDRRKSQGRTRYIGTRELIGRIEITDNPLKPDFKIISSREGIVKDDSYFDLVQQERNNSFFFRTFRRLERYVVDGLKWDSIPFDSLSEIDNQVDKAINGKVSEVDLVFSEDAKIKRRRISEIVDSIIKIGDSKITYKYINEALILEKIKVNIEKANTEFNQLLNKIEQESDTPTKFLDMLYKMTNRNNALKEQLLAFKKANTINDDKELVKEYKHSSKLIESQQRLISDLKQQLENSTLEKEIVNEKLVDSQQAVENLQEKLETEKLKTEFYKKQVSKDTDALIHHIKNDSSTIITTLELLLNRTRNEKKIPQDIKDSFISELHYAMFHAEKCHKAASIITHVDLAESDTQLINIGAFLKGYLENYKELSTDNSVNIMFQHTGGDYQLLSSKTELALIIDNLLNNSIKWEATEVLIETISNDPNEFEIIISDNGLGLSKKYLDDPTVIFNFRETDLGSGTGLGLYLVKEKLEEMGGKVSFIGNNTKLEGATFKVRFKR